MRRKKNKYHTFEMSNILIFICLLIFSGNILGQQRTISGKITDANTSEPIAFANVFIKGTTSGTTTDFDGKYLLKTSQLGDSLSVMVVGFLTKSKFIEKRENQAIDFKLTPTIFTLEEVVIVAGENPAHEIIKKAAENKEKYRIENLNAYQYKSYVNIDLSFDKLSENFKNSSIFKGYTQIFDSLENRAEKDELAVLPFYLSESIKSVYFRKNPKRRKQVVEASKQTCLIIESKEIIDKQIGTGFDDFDFNYNWIHLIKRHFISPIAKGGLGYYKYYIMDTIMIENDSCYEIAVFAKRPIDAVFQGKIWISKHNYALRRVDLEINDQANFNFVERLKIQQDYSNIDSNYYVPTNTRLLIDAIELNEKSTGFIMKFYVSNSNFKLNDPLPTSFFDNNVAVKSDAYLHSAAYWSKKRAELLSDTTQLMQSIMIIDSMRNIPTIARTRKIIETIWDGYFPLGYVQAGYWPEMFGYNKIEGFRIQGALETTMKFSQKWRLQTKTAYGFKDTRVKGSFTVERFLNREKWRLIGIQAKHDIVRLGINEDILEGAGFESFMFIFSSQFGSLPRMSLSDQIDIYFQTDLWRGWTYKIKARWKNFNPQAGFVFAWYDDNGIAQQSYKQFSLSLQTSYSAKRVWMVEDNWRYGANSLRSPQITFSAAIGIKGVSGSDFNYQKFSLNLAQFWETGTIGRFDYSITALKLFGTVPYSEAFIPQGNESYFSDRRSFNMMNFFEFAIDQGVTGHILHHFNGLILNRIPVMNRLKWRCIAGADFIWGDYNKNNYIETAPNTKDALMPLSYKGEATTTFNQLSIEKPYVEISYGIENIFRLISIRGFNRLTYTSAQNRRKISNFGIKIAFVLQL